MSMLDKIEARHARLEQWWLARHPDHKFSQCHQDVVKLLTALRAVEALHKPNPDDSETGQVCSHCIEAIAYDFWAVEWPCPTIKAIEETR